MCFYMELSHLVPHIWLHYDWYDNDSEDDNSDDGGRRRRILLSEVPTFTHWEAQGPWGLRSSSGSSVGVSNWADWDQEKYIHYGLVKDIVDIPDNIE